MENNKARFNSIDEYIATFPEEIRTIRQEIRETIKAAENLKKAGLKSRTRK